MILRILKKEPYYMYDEYKVDDSIVINKTMFDAMNPLSDALSYSNTIKMPVSELSKTIPLNEYLQVGETYYDGQILTDDGQFTMEVKVLVENVKDGIVSLRVYDNGSDIVNKLKKNTLSTLLVNEQFEREPSIHPQMLSKQVTGDVTELVDYASFNWHFYDEPDEEYTYDYYYGADGITMSICRSDNEDYFDDSTDGETVKYDDVPSALQKHWEWTDLGGRGLKRTDGCTNNQFQRMDETGKYVGCHYQVNQLVNVPMNALINAIGFSVGIEDVGTDIYNDKVQLSEIPTSLKFTSKTDIDNRYPSQIDANFFEGMGAVVAEIDIHDDCLVGNATVSINTGAYLFVSTENDGYNIFTSFTPSLMFEFIDENGESIGGTGYRLPMLDVGTNKVSVPSTGGRKYYLFTKGIDIATSFIINSPKPTRKIRLYSKVFADQLDGAVTYHFSFSKNTNGLVVEGVGNCLGKISKCLPNIFNLNAADVVKYYMMINKLSLDGNSIKRRSFTNSGKDISKQIISELGWSPLKSISPSKIVFKYKDNEVDKDFGKFTVDVGGLGGEVIYEAPIKLSIGELHQDKMYESRFSYGYISDDKITMNAKRGDVYVGLLNDFTMNYNGDKFLPITHMPSYVFLKNKDFTTLATGSMHNVQCVDTLKESGIKRSIAFGEPTITYDGTIDYPTCVYERNYKKMFSELYDERNKRITVKMIVDTSILEPRVIYKYKDMNVFVVSVKDYDIQRGIATVTLQTVINTNMLTGK